MSFDITFLGTLGGPIEASTCALLVKPHGVEYSAISPANLPLLQIDAGSGYLLLAELIADKQSPSRLLRLYGDCGKIEDYVELKPCFPFADLSENAFGSLKRVMLCVPTVLLTHPHLDHIAALVLNLAEVDFKNNGLTVYGSQFTAETLKKHIFNGKVWPDMISLGTFALAPVEAKSPFTTNNGIYKVTMFELQHGVTQSDNGPVPYLSLAYLIHHIPSDSRLLVFGDFEADSNLGKEYNRQIWLKVAPFIADGSLKAIVLECSMATQKEPAELYGHLMPQHLIGELEVLLAFSSKSLNGFNVIVTHVKDTPGALDPRKQVLQELRDLAKQSGLGVRFSMALSGLSVTI